MNKSKIDELFDEMSNQLPDPNNYEQDWFAFVVSPNLKNDMITGETSQSFTISFKKMPAKGGYIWEPDVDNTGWER